MVEWAPLKVPVGRRMQTAMALFWIGSLLLGGPLGYILGAYIMLYTSLWPLMCLYLGFLYLDRERCHQGGRKLGWLRRLPCWRHYVEFFPLNLVKVEDLPPDKNYLFCVYPHGLLSAGAFGHFATEYTTFSKLFPGLEAFSATLNLHFNAPFFRDYLLALGAVSASKESIHHVLSSEEKGKVLVLVVGGAAESLYARPGSYRIIIKNRKGFVKAALKAGSPLVPVFSFGENDLYDQVSNPPGSLTLKIQNVLRKVTGLAPCMPIGRGILQYSFGPIPRRFPVTTVVGSPIELPKVEDPSPELINEYHRKFMQQLTSLFEFHKHKYVKNPEDSHLEME